MIKVLFLLLLSLAGSLNLLAQKKYDNQGALIRSDQSQQSIYLMFSGHDFYEGFEHVLSVLEKKNIKGSFFLTGDFVRKHSDLIQRMVAEGHFIGAHSDKHLLYNAWENRDSLLHSREVIKKDISDNLIELRKLGLEPSLFLPPYEWYNQKVVEIARELGQETINFSPGTRSNADYTTPEMSNYLGSNEILESIYTYESANGMNGFHLLIHPGTSPERTDKLYFNLDSLIADLMEKGYSFEKF
ncbi:polysaccharide deacetylase family protein [Algoriphagus sp.]|uniref:polysaccharide deacetylase family protein n=1 Tax=Algoriphagus sp. TaxID=1872435 RepID=UPI0025FA0BA2|nr:polysaccharide deacetylase family protein [Algoriphagus sp.]